MLHLLGIEIAAAGMIRNSFAAGERRTAHRQRGPIAMSVLTLAQQAGGTLAWGSLAAPRNKTTHPGPTTSPTANSPRNSTNKSALPLTDIPAGESSPFTSPTSDSLVEGLRILVPPPSSRSEKTQRPRFPFPSPPPSMESHGDCHSPTSPQTSDAASCTAAAPGSGHSSASCARCGGPTAYPTPPPSFSGVSPPPTYRPIRAPAVNVSSESLYSQQQAIILAPVPQSQKVPIVSPPHQFQVPVKRIHSPEDIRRFHEADVSKNFLGFVVALSESIRGRKISDSCHESSTVSAIVSILETLVRWIEEIPPVQQAARYGNVSYRSWHERLVETSESLMLTFLPDDLRSATVEIVPYFTDSFGNSSRIDYGTGHETNFTAWLYCLARMGVIKEEDYQAVVGRVFVKYLELMRKLQLVYSLEPAGSHGVWGLDDYHFLPFVFGSSQLIGHKYMKPKSIHNEDILENFSNEYMYFSCIAFIRKVKKGLFAEHSPLLDDISGVPNWNKVNSGLLKMYKAEVLEKVPIMQHFLFGWLIKWE